MPRQERFAFGEKGLPIQDAWSPSVFASRTNSAGTHESCSKTIERIGQFANLISVSFLMSS